MRATIGFVTSMLAATAIGQVKLAVQANGFPNSTATIFHKVLPDGSKLNQMTIEMNGSEGRKIKVRTERTYAPDGKPIRVFHEVIGERPAMRRQVTVTFDEAGARAVIDEGGKRTVKEVPLVNPAPRECLPEFWFIRDQPVIGDSIKYYHFDANKVDWVVVQAKYVGPVTYNFGGKAVKAFKVTTATGEAIVDEKGLPYKVTEATVTMTRI